VIPWTGGIARISMVAQGIGRIAVTGTSQARVALAAVANGMIAARGESIARMLITGWAGIPYPIRRPTKFAAAHPSRWLRVERDAKTAAAFARERTITITADHRTVHVAPERNP
jgi:hypothetical protein